MWKHKELNSLVEVRDLPLSESNDEALVEVRNAEEPNTTSVILTVKELRDTYDCWVTAD